MPTTPITLAQVMPLRKMRPGVSDTPPKVQPIMMAAPPGELLDVVEAPRPGGPSLAWVAIVAMVAFIAGLQAYRSRERGADVRERSQSLAIELQARYIVGSTRLLPGGEQAVLPTLRAGLQTGPPDSRLMHVVLLGDLQGPDAALDALKQVRGQLHDAETPSEQMAQLLPLLEQLYRDYQRGAVPSPNTGPEERQHLQEALPWVGALALNPAGGPAPAVRAELLAGARRTAIVLLGTMGLFCFALVLGLGGLILGLVLLCTRRLGVRFRCGSRYGGVYAESFAVWMALFLVLGWAVSHVRLPGWPLLPGAIAAVCSLAALAWPLLRGVPAQRLWADLGLHTGRPWFEPFTGVVGYAMALPFLVVGILLMTLMRLAAQRAGLSSGDPSEGSHPLITFVGNAGPREWFQIFLVAVVIAPIVEEIAFRGLLYRHLREASARWGFYSSALVSGLVNSFVFAAIHPQGWLGVPVLMGLALAFSLLREWRDSLVPAMLAHGLNNGAVTVFLMLALGK